MHAECTCIYIFTDNIPKLLRLHLLPCYRMVKIGIFSKRSGAATKEFQFCYFLFQLAFFSLNAVLYVLNLYIWLEQNYLKIIPLSLYIRLEYS